MTENISLNHSELAPFSWQQDLWQQLMQSYKQGQLAHALLLTGGSGLGKSAFLQSFSRFMICQSQDNTTACETCANCRLSASGFHPDILSVKVQEGSKGIKIEQIRALSEFSNKSNHSADCKIIIIQQAHLLNSNSANALLKTLEEPNQNTFIFLTSNLPGQLLATIRSRCQIVKFPEASRQQAESWLEPRLDEATKGGSLKLLAAASNRPLLALQLAEAGELESLAAFLNALTQLKQGASSKQAVCRLAGKIGESTALRYLALSSATLIKQLLSGTGNEGEQNNAISVFCSTITCKTYDLKMVLRALLAFDQELAQARRQLRSTTNPNAQLLLESIIWRWEKLPLSLS